MSSPLHKFLAAMVAGLFVSVAVQAEDVPPQVKAAIDASMAVILPEVPYEALAVTPVAGLYKVSLEGGRFLYFAADGQTMISGEMYQLANDELVNLAEAERKVVRHDLIAGIDPEGMIVFSPKGKTRAVINVFTDVDCGYCRKLHLEVPELNSAGVEVRYLAYPRAGINSMSYAKIASAWCAKDPNQALTKLKTGEDIPIAVCEGNPVADHFRLGNDMGVQGTPALVLMDGTLIPGYQPADALVEMLGLNN